MTTVDLPERLQKWLKPKEGLTPKEDAPEEVKEEIREIRDESEPETVIRGEPFPEDL